MGQVQEEGEGSEETSRHELSQQWPGEADARVASRKQRLKQ